MLWNNFCRLKMNLNLRWNYVGDATFQHTSKSLRLTIKQQLTFTEPQDKGVPWVWNPLLPTLPGVGSLGGRLLDPGRGTSCLLKVRMLTMMRRKRITMNFMFVQSDEEEIIFWCGRCDYEGHNEVVHDAEDFKQVGNKMFWHFHSSTPQQTLSNVRRVSNFYQQRRAVVDTLGWEPFQNWFYDQTFRGWWQVRFLALWSNQIQWKLNGLSLIR